MSATTLVSNVGNMPNATGMGMQRHIVYAENAGKWLHFYLKSTNQLQCDWFTNWGDVPTSAGTLTLAQSHNSEGRNFAVLYLNQSSTDTIHLQISYKVSGTDHRTYHNRATFASGTITWGTETETGTTNSGADPFNGWDGPNVGFGTDQKVYAGAGYWVDSNGGMNFDVIRFPNADNAGASWTFGSPTLTQVGGAVTNDIFSHAMFPLASGSMLALADDSNGSGFPRMTNVLYSVWNGTSWAATGNVFASSADVDDTDWGAVGVSTTDIHVVRYEGSGVYTHRRFNGSAWSNGNTIPSLTSTKDATNLCLSTDGTNAWLIVIDSGAANAIKYIKWTSGTGWDAAWTILESTSATRTRVSCTPKVSNNQIGVIWTEGSANPFSIKGEALTLSSSHSLTNTAVAKGQVTSTLTVKHQLSATATARAKDTATLTVKHRLAASAVGKLHATGVLQPITHHLSATAIGKAKATSALTEVHHLVATASAKAQVSATLKVVHHLSATGIAKAKATSALTFRHALGGTAVGRFYAELVRNGQHPLSATAGAKAHAQAQLTVLHHLSATATAKAKAQSTVTFHHTLAAVAQAKAHASVNFTATHHLAATAAGRLRAIANLTAGIPLQSVLFSLVQRLNPSLNVIQRLGLSLSTVQNLSATFKELQALPQPHSTVTSTATATNISGSPEPGCTPVTCTVTFPDKSTQSFSLGSGIVNNGNGTYSLTYVTGGPGDHKEDWSFTGPSGDVATFRNMTPCTY